MACIYMLSTNAKVNITLQLKKKEWLKETNQLFYHLIKCICKIYVSALKTQSLRIPAFSFIESSFMIISKQKFDHVSKLLSSAMHLSHLYGQSHLSLSRNIPSAANHAGSHIRPDTAPGGGEQHSRHGIFSARGGNPGHFGAHFPAISKNIILYNKTPRYTPGLFSCFAKVIETAKKVPRSAPVQARFQEFFRMLTS